MFEHVNDGAHVADPVQVHFPWRDLAAGKSRNEFVDLGHDATRTEKSCARAHYRGARVALRRRPAIDVDKEVAGLPRMALKLEPVGEMADHAMGDIDFERRKAVGRRDGKHQGFQKFPGQGRFVLVHHDPGLGQPLVLDEGPQLGQGLPEILLDRQVTHELPLQPHRGRAHRARHHHRNLVADFSPALAVSLELPHQMHVSRFELRTI